MVLRGVATFGLLLTILLSLRARPEAVAASVGLYIAAAYWFTASTSFANPAVTIARALSDTFPAFGLATFPFHRGAARRRSVPCGGGVGLAAARPAVRQASASGREMTMTSHLSQPGVRHLAQHPCHDPAERRGADRHRVPEDPPSAELIGLIARMRHHAARAVAPKRARLMTNWASPTPNGPTSTDRLHGSAPHPHQPAVRRDAPRHAPLPPIGARSRDPVQPRHRAIH